MEKKKQKNKNKAKEKKTAATTKTAENRSRTGQHIRNFLHKTFIKRPSRNIVVQNDDKEMYKKVCCSGKVISFFR